MSEEPFCMMGGPAALQLGRGAVNLAGRLYAAARISVELLNELLVGKEGWEQSAIK